MSQNLPSRRSQEFSSQDSNSTLTAKWLLVSFFNCDLPRDIINEAMRNVSPKPSKWMVAREMNLPESWTICVLVEYEREMTIDSHIFNFFGELNWLKAVDSGAIYHERSSSLNSERYYENPQDIIDLTEEEEEEEENHKTPRRCRSRSRSPKPAKKLSPSILGHQYRMRSDSPPSSPSPPRTTINEIPISIRTSSNRKSQASPISLPHETSANRNSQASSISFSHGTSPILNSQASAILVPHGTFPNRIIEAPSTSTSPANSPTQRHYPETYIGPLPATYIGPFPPRPEPVAHHSSPQELQQGNNQSDSFRLANQSPPTLEPNANSPAKKQAESKRPCAKKVSFAEEMLSSSPNNDPIGSQRNIGNSNSQDSSNPSNEAPRPAMKAPKNYIRPPNEENRQIRQLETTENQSSGQPEQIARDLANTTISSSSINNQDRISINLNNESQIKVVEVEIKDKSHQSLGSIEFKLNLRPSEAEIPNGRENFWGCPICGNINSSKIEFCPMCIAHRYWANS